ncbi:MAG TPA: hypothetical protein PLE32_14980, partial [Haliscomenobacter sp.]|nr:hypothetical protein [Haliscomenobacter sp.]
LKLMYLNYGVLGFYTPQMEAFNYILKSSSPNNAKNLNDAELASKWIGSNNASVDISVAFQGAVSGLVLCYAGPSHNIKEIQIYSVDGSNQEKLLHKGTPGTYRNVYQFSGGSLKGQTIRIRFVSTNNQAVEVNEIMAIQSHHQTLMQVLNGIPPVEKIAIAVPFSRISN